MVLGDDDRRQKNRKKREAAYRRWENTGERARRRTAEGIVDGFDFVLGLLLRLLMLPFRIGARLLRAVRRGGGR